MEVVCGDGWGPYYESTRVALRFEEYKISDVFFNLTCAQTLFFCFDYKENFVMDIRESRTIKMKAQNSLEVRYKI